MSRVSLYDAVVGPSDVQQAITANAQDAINVMIEQVVGGGVKVPRYDIGTPGVRPWLTLPTLPIRALFQQDQRAFAIGGDTLYEVFALPSYTARAVTMATNEYMACIVSNGSAGDQLLITSGDIAYVYDLTANTNTVITDLNGVRCRMCEFIDGYGIVQVTETRRFQISALEDFTTWDGLDVAERSMASDNIAAIIRVGRRIMLNGTKTSEDWYDNGDPLFPFAPTQESLMEHGGLAPFTARRFGDTAFWVGQDEDGQGVVWRLQNVTPSIISTPAISRLIQASGVPPDNDLRLAVAWTYQQNAHSFYCLQLPVCDWMLVYDMLTGLWHKRAAWDSTNYRWLRDRGQCHMHFAGKHLVGDRLTGTIYEMSTAFYDAELTDV